MNVYLDKLDEEMREAASNLDFELAANLRDRIQMLREKNLGLTK